MDTEDRAGDLATEEDGGDAADGVDAASPVGRVMKEESISSVFSEGSCVDSSVTREGDKWLCDFFKFDSPSCCYTQTYGMYSWNSEQLKILYYEGFTTRDDSSSLRDALLTSTSLAHRLAVADPQLYAECATDALLVTHGGPRFRRGDPCVRVQGHFARMRVKYFFFFVRDGSRDSFFVELRGWKASPRPS